MQSLLWCPILSLEWLTFINKQNKQNIKTASILNSPEFVGVACSMETRLEIIRCKVYDGVNSAVDWDRV